MVELRDEHRRHPVKRGTAFRLDGLQGGERGETLARIDHRRAVRQAAEIADHHAKAMVERHRDANPVAVGEFHRLGDEKAVVEDVVVREGRALRKAGGARGELDVDRVVELQFVGQRGEASALGGTGERRNIIEAQHAGHALHADADREPQGRQPRRGQLARSGIRQLRREVAQHPDVVAGLEAGRGDQRGAAGFVKRVFELGDAIGRVNIDQDQPGLGGGELRDGPFGVVRRPDADPLAWFQAEREEAGGERIDPLFQLAVAPANLLMARDQRVARREAFGDAIEMDADRLADQRRVADAVDITWLRHLHPSRWDVILFGRSCGRSCPAFGQ
jgi:hypothetical protein